MPTLLWRLLPLFCLALLPAQEPRQPRVFRATPEGLVPAELPKLWFGFVDRGQRVMLEIDGARATASTDAGPLPATRVKRTGTLVQVVDVQGQVAAQVRLTADGGVLETFPDRKRLSLGVRLLPVSEAMAAKVSRPAADLRLVAAVVPGLGAEAAGLRAGDLLLEIDGGSVSEARLRELVATRKPGDKLKVASLREGVAMTSEVELRSAAPAVPGSESRPAIEFLDGALFVIGAPGGSGRSDGIGEVTRELRQLGDRLQKLEALMQQSGEKGK